MPQIFHENANTLSRLTIFGSILLLIALGWTLVELAASPWVSQADVVREQPVPFSHKHHAGGLGIDCRYCHDTVERSSFAGMPSTETCMTCHTRIWSDSAMLAPVRESYRSGRSIEWVRVNDVPDFVYFDHRIHVHAGFACSQCHGQVELMPLTWRAGSLQMRWCLDCHRHPSKRPEEALSRTDCYTCHR